VVEGVFVCPTDADRAGTSGKLALASTVGEAVELSGFLKFATIKERVELKRMGGSNCCRQLLLVVSSTMCSDITK